MLRLEWDRVQTGELLADLLGIQAQLKTGVGIDACSFNRTIPRKLAIVRDFMDKHHCGSRE